MMQRNCPNCAAPYDVEFNKCPYCGTSYYDLSALDLSAREPFYLKIKVDMNGQPCYITQLVRPRIDNISMEFNSDTVEYRSGIGNMVTKVTRNNSLVTNLSFEAVVSDTHKNLCTIETDNL